MREAFPTPPQVSAVAGITCSPSQELAFWKMSFEEQFLGRLQVSEPVVLSFIGFNHRTLECWLTSF